MTYRPMRGAEEDQRENPPVQSKFDKSQGKGLPAPHLTHPGAVAKETGSKHPGFNENGHMLAREVGGPVGDSTIHRVTQHSPASLGSGMAEGRRSYGEPNIAATDHVVAKPRTVPMERFAGHEPDPVKAGGDLHRGQHDTRKAGRLGTEERGSSRQVYGGERVDRASHKSGPGVLHANKRGSGPNLR
jgi:hypothetical protein